MEASIIWQELHNMMTPGLKTKCDIFFGFTSDSWCWPELVEGDGAKQAQLVWEWEHVTNP